MSSTDGTAKRHPGRYPLLRPRRHIFIYVIQTPLQEEWQCGSTCRRASDRLLYPLLPCGLSIYMYMRSIDADADILSHICAMQMRIPSSSRVLLRSSFSHALGGDFFLIVKPVDCPFLLRNDQLGNRGAS